MRREAFLAVLLMSMVVLAGASTSQGQEPASTPLAQTQAVTAIQPPRAALASDTVSGCVRGAALVKVLIFLHPKEDRCVPEVTPASVCVAPGGVVRFKIQNECRLPVEKGREGIEITRPRFRRSHAPRPEPGPPRHEDRPIFENCSLQIPQLAARHVIHCDVREDAAPGFYKYGLTGIVSLDPDVEVQPGDQ